MNTKQRLKQLVEARSGLIVPGAFNALSAKVIADLGFQAIYVTGAGVTKNAAQQVLTGALIGFSFGAADFGIGTEGASFSVGMRF